MSGTVSAAVTLTSGTYVNPTAATIVSSQYSATGVYGPADSGTLTNQGTIAGAVGFDYALNRFGFPGGDGVNLQGNVSATNTDTGVIIGGAGGYGYSDVNRRGAEGGRGA